MKKCILIAVLSILIFNLSQAQKTKRDKFMQVINTKYPKHEIDTVKNSEIILTRIWEMYATIPVEESHIADFEGGIGAICFTVYLSESSKDFEIMKSEDITSMDQVDNRSEFTGGSQRLIQVIFYDFKNDKYLGKPEQFPITGLPWIPEYFEIPLEHTFVESLLPVKDSDNTCLLTIAEFSNEHPEKLYYVFKFHENKLLCSKPHRGSLKELKAEKNKIIGIFYGLEEYKNSGEFEKILLETEE